MNMNTKTLKEAARLYKMGFAIHWLHQKSKRPIESGWTTGPRKPWAELKESFNPVLNVGVRLGTPSKIKGAGGVEGYLAVVDVDVKSTDERHRKEAIKAAKEILNGVTCPIVLSGRGNGSRHYYCITQAPFKTFNPAVSPEKVKVFMPSKKPSKAELAELTDAEIKQGLRIANAWEISLYSDGRQVVLPPSIHPDSNKPYLWSEHLTNAESLPMIEFKLPEATPLGAAGAEGPVSPVRGETVNDFEVEDVNLDWISISDKMKDAIVNGTGVNDRSGYLLPASTALLSAGLTKNEILSVLTDRETFLGACAFEHAKTNSRKRAALWVWKYTLKKVMEERDAVALFSKAAKIEPIKILSDNLAKAQTEEIEGETDWRTYLERDNRGKYQNTFNNCKLIVQNVCPIKEFTGRDEFAGNDFYLTDTPWGSKNKEAITDIDIVRIKDFCAEKYGVEFHNGMINDVLLSVADRNRYHPVRDWIKTLRWDGVPRIDTWLKDFAGAEAPEPYLSEVSSKFLVAMITRIFKPGAKFDTILILEGDQGTGKSTLLEKLVGEDWFTDAPIVIGDKDTVMTIQSKWLIELGELSGMSKSDLELFKAFVAQRKDRIRLPYGKRTEEFPRQIVFAGTTNLDEYLRDLTGNRRFWSVKLTAEKIDFKGIAEVRAQLFAEAYAYFQLGETIHLEGEAEAQAKKEQAKRLHTDDWMPTVLDIVQSDGFPLAGFELRDVAKRMDTFGAHRMSPLDAQRIGRCLKMLGFDKFQEGAGARRKLWRAGRNFVTRTATNLDEPRAKVPNNTNDIEDFFKSEPRNLDFL